MPEVSDVDLMELADGTLPEPRRRMVEAELARHPELRQRLEAFLVTGKALARLFDPVIDAPLPPGLLGTIERDPSPAPRVLPFATDHAAARRQRAAVRPGWGWAFASGMSLAATVVAVVGVAAVIWTLQPEGDSRLAAGALALALEKAPSYQKTELSLAGYGLGVARSDLSFQHVDGRYCRQYVVGFKTGGGFVGYACSAGQGRWRIEQEIEIAAGDSALTEALRPAGPHPAFEAIDEAAGKVSRGDALASDQELAVMRRGWTAEGQ